MKKVISSQLFAVLFSKVVLFAFITIATVLFIPGISTGTVKADTITEKTITPAEEPEDNRPWNIVKMRVTAYCPCEKCCGQFADGITASGHKIQPGDTFVAADKRFAFGTEMIIEGYGNSKIVKVLDRGGAIKGNKLDVFFKTHQEALEWGVHYIDVKVRYK